MSVSTVWYLSKAVISLLLVGAAVMYCQTKPRLPQTVTEVYLQGNINTEAVILSLAKAMPEDKYSFPADQWRIQKCSYVCAAGEAYRCEQLCRPCRAAQRETTHRDA